MDGKDFLVTGSIAILVLSVVLAFLGLSQAVVSGIISAVGTGAGILWKWLDKRRESVHQPIKQTKAPPEGEKPIVNEAPTIGGGGRRADFEIQLEEGEGVKITTKATEGRYSVGLLSETDYRLQKRSGDYDMEWYYKKQRGIVRRAFKPRRKGSWYLVIWNEESYPLQVSVKVNSVKPSRS